MRMFIPAVVAATLIFSSAAEAAVLTLGSDLSKSSTQTEAHGQDTAFWMTQIGGQSAAFPEDGQVISVTTKGSVLREPGAGDPANMVHFQSLVPGEGNQTEVLSTSGWHYLPISEPNALRTYEMFDPSSALCVKKGGYLAINNIGGFQYGGALDRVDPAHYHQGAPFQIFAPAGDATTMRYSHHNGTNNGATLNPEVGGDASGPNGSVNRGQELLMSYKIATGDDRMEACGGPRRHADGTLVQTEPQDMYMTVTKFQGSEQMPYVSAQRTFEVGIYCGGEVLDACVGRAQFSYLRKTPSGAKRRVWAPRRGVRFTVPALSSARIAFSLPEGIYQQLIKRDPKRWKVQFRMRGIGFPTLVQPLTLMQ